MHGLWKKLIRAFHLSLYFYSWSCKNGGVEFPFQGEPWLWIDFKHLHTSVFFELMFDRDQEGTTLFQSTRCDMALMNNCRKFSFWSPWGPLSPGQGVVGNVFGKHFDATLGGRSWQSKGRSPETYVCAMSPGGQQPRAVLKLWGAGPCPRPPGTYTHVSSTTCGWAVTVGPDLRHEGQDGFLLWCWWAGAPRG